MAISHFGSRAENVQNNITNRSIGLHYANISRKYHHVSKFESKNTISRTHRHTVTYLLSKRRIVSICCTVVPSYRPAFAVYPSYSPAFTVTSPYHSIIAVTIPCYIRRYITITFPIRCYVIHWDGPVVTLRRRVYRCVKDRERCVAQCKKGRTPGCLYMQERCIEECIREEYMTSKLC